MRVRLFELRSLRLRLLLTLSVPLLLITAAGVLLDDRSARSLLGESHDRALASTAIGLAARVETDRDGDLPAHLVATMRAVSRLGEAEDLSYLVLGGDGRRLAGDLRLAPLVRPVQAQNPAIYDAVLAGRPVRAVTYGYAGPDGRATIIVTEALGRRIADAHRMLLPTLVTNAVMALALALSAVVAVGIALRPLDALGQRVEGHEVQALRPMRLRGLPAETRPLVRAINRLMVRLRRTTQARQQFIDNTAHQLRTPLAGLQAQVTLLGSEPMPAPAKARVQELQAGVQRLAHLTQQMLALARAGGPSSSSMKFEPVGLPGLLEHAASHCLDAAVARDIDLAFEAAAAVVQGSPWMLQELVMNLVDNAIGHSPPGSAVTVRCGSRDARPFIEVEDNGPGIPGSERARVFGRHVRLQGDAGPGAGLGLAIVREIAERHHAGVTLGEGRGGHGLLARVEFRP